MSSYNPNPPSYLYSYLDDKTLTMARDLDSFPNGGDAKAVPWELHVIAKSNHLQQVNIIHVRGLRAL